MLLLTSGDGDLAAVHLLPEEAVGRPPQREHDQLRVAVVQLEEEHDLGLDELVSVEREEQVVVAETVNAGETLLR